MSFGGEFENDQVMSDINMTPMVDVMLVLLIIFMITLPVLTHSVKIDLPQAESHKSELKPESIFLSITQEALIYWNDELIDQAQLEERLNMTAKQEPQPELQLRGAKQLAYEQVIKVMSAAQKAGIKKLGFITQL